MIGKDANLEKQNDGYIRYILNRLQMSRWYTFSGNMYMSIRIILRRGEKEAVTNVVIIGMKCIEMEGLMDYKRANDTFPGSMPSIVIGILIPLIIRIGLSIEDPLDIDVNELFDLVDSEWNIDSHSGQHFEALQNINERTTMDIEGIQEALTNVFVTKYMNIIEDRKLNRSSYANPRF